jgi:probable HAF family extracellular repeat protein
VRGTCRNLIRTAAAVAAVAATVAFLDYPAYAYDAPIDLGTLSGGYSNAWAISLNEEIAGNSDGMPVIWLNRQIQQLPLPAGFVGGSARDINDAGQVVGYVWDANGLTRAVRWDSPDSATLLEQSAPGGSAAYGINENGTITGFVNNGFGSDPAIFTNGGAQRQTPVNQNGSGYTVSKDQGVIIGYYRSGGVMHAFENGISPPTAGGYMTLPSVQCCFRATSAWAITADNTMIFGSSTMSGGTTHPTMWKLDHNSLGWPTWRAVDLGVPGGSGSATINDTNEWGTYAVGSSVTGLGQSLAFYWQSGGLGNTVLPTPPGDCGNSANGINGVEEIVGKACGANGQAHAMLWT